MKLFDAAGFAMLTLTTKKVGSRFLPVGEKDYTAVIKTQDGFVVILTDNDGCTKAQSKAMEKNEAFGVFDKLTESGVPEFAGDAVEIWTERYPKVAHR